MLFVLCNAEDQNTVKHRASLESRYEKFVAVSRSISATLHTEGIKIPVYRVMVWAGTCGFEIQQHIFYTYKHSGCYNQMK